MKIKVLTNIGTNDFPSHPYKEGWEGDCDSQTATSMIGRGFAICTETIKAIPPPLEIVTVDKATDDLKKYRDKQVKPQATPETKTESKT